MELVEDPLQPPIKKCQYRNVKKIIFLEDHYKILENIYFAQISLW